jgi:AbrB-like transcriptional regulator
MTNETKRLTGKALLQKLKEIEHLSRREKARECGYVTTTKSNEIRVSSGEFLSAVLEAKGIALDTGEEKSGRGREATYRVSVHQNGQILIGQAYTQKMGLKPGDEFEIKLGYKHIQLVQLGGGSEEG